MGVYKLNTDAAVNSKNNCVGQGLVIRNHRGMVMASSAQNMDMLVTPYVAEAMAILKGLVFVVDIGLLPVAVETDALNVVNLIKSDLQSNSFVEGVSHKIKRQIEDLERVSDVESGYLAVDRVPFDFYLTRFVWDDLKCPAMSRLREIMDDIHTQVSEIEDDVKCPFFKKSICMGEGLAEELGIFPLCVESDALGIVRLCNGVVSLCNDIDNIISDVFVLKANCTDVSIVHTSRNCNRLAHSIARFAVFSGFSDVWHIDLPEWLSC
ncbi:hypothetical protein Dsin_032032 [Dipteronia sinensis]|uniref:RNase H type-1 domain-containing protein n=1 Tax=Dipteronia sinensis TaxID=43782 RepID=A0AAD9ZM50_9ROSI|nr:hypothetical protein Dsin_032032 [Dipteronia sinensis]